MSGWMAAAACAGQDPELFFPATPAAAEQARAVCVACPVRLACLDSARAQDDRHTVRGGLTPKERRALEAGICEAALAVTVLPAPARPAGPADIIAEVKALEIPPDPGAGMHCEVLLRELAAFHAAHSRDLLAERRRRPVPAAALGDGIVREARNQAQRARRAGLAIPVHLAVLEREQWRRDKQTRRAAARSELSNAA